jgi:hypothetical protein
MVGHLVGEYIEYFFSSFTGQQQDEWQCEKRWTTSLKYIRLNKEKRGERVKKKNKNNTSVN